MVLAAQENTNYSVPEVLPVGAFRTYDIRGATGPGGLTEDVAYAVGLAFGSAAAELGVQEVVVARDGRLTGPAFHQAVVTGLRETGRDVLNIGQVPSPVLYFATQSLPTATGIMVTASHNPRDDNGFKMVLDGKTLTTEGVQAILKRIQARDFVQGAGTLRDVDIQQAYFEAITSRITLARPLKVVVDCGSGVAGDWAPTLYRQLGCDVVELFCEVDGHFPHHHPDPTIPDNLKALQVAVAKTQADIGIAFDGDADRLGVVTNTGEIIWPDRQMMLYAQEVLSRVPGAEIVFDVKCSQHLAKVIAAHGGRPVMYRTGHSLLKAKMLSLNAPLAGEMSGHIFFNDEWFGFDDGLYVGARLLRILSAYAGTCHDLFDAFPHSVNTPELKLPMAEDKKASFMTRLLEAADFGSAKRITIDGLRVEFEKGWGLVRPSNTSAYLTLRFEADTQADLDWVMTQFRRALLSIDPTLELPF